jgi:uncharacterized phosphatase
VLRRVFLVRHCESEANREALAEARGDSALTERGVEQAARRAAALGGFELTEVRVFASPLIRAQATARAIAEHHGWGDVSHDERLIETDLGRLEGATYREVIASLAPGQRTLQPELHGGEADGVVAARMLAAIADALAAAPGPVVLVSHGFAIGALLRELGQEGGGLLSNGDMVDLDLEDGATVRRLELHRLD